MHSCSHQFSLSNGTYSTNPGRTRGAAHPGPCTLVPWNRGLRALFPLDQANWFPGSGTTAWPPYPPPLPWYSCMTQATEDIIMMRSGLPGPYPTCLDVCDWRYTAALGDWVLHSKAMLTSAAPVEYMRQKTELVGLP